MNLLRPIVLLLAGLLTIPAAYADISTGVNKIRSRGCGGKSGASAPLKPSRALDEVAREWSRGGRLHDAVARTDYRVLNSASMRVEGTKDERMILEVLSSGYCNTILDPSFTEIGVYQRGDGVWVVVASPLTMPTERDAPEIAQRVLALVNEARANSRKCGTLVQPAVPPLKPSAQLDAAALVHAEDMASHNFFEHRGSDGSGVSDRVTRIGYPWKTVGENIAAGSTDAETVVKGWLDSPGHCKNIMRADYKEMGVAYATNPKSRAGIYWSQVFATVLDKVDQKPAKKKK